MSYKKHLDGVWKRNYAACAALRAVIIDKENPCYESVEGVLYKKENVKLTEIVLYPTKNSEYRTALSLGAREPENAAEAMAFRENMECSEDNMPQVGEDWLPQYRKGVLRDVETVNDSKRRES